MTFDLLVIILSSIMIMVASVILIKISKTNKKYKRVYALRDNIEFVEKKTPGGMHSKYKFVINDQGVSVVDIYVIDRTGLHIGLINPGSSPEIIKCNHKTVGKYKHAKLLLQYLTIKIKDWKI